MLVVPLREPERVLDLVVSPEHPVDALLDLVKAEWDQEIELVLCSIRGVLACEPVERCVSRQV